MMKISIISIQQYCKSIALFSMMGVACTLPWSLKFNSISIIVFAIATLIAYGPIQIVKSINKLSLLHLSLYIIHVIGMLYTTNASDGGFELEKKLSLLIFPLFMPVQQLSSKQLYQVLYAFAISCATLIFYLIVVACVKLYFLQTSIYFYGGALIIPNGIHRVYLAMYVLWSLVICVEMLKIDRWKWDRIFTTFSIGIFLLAMYLFVARMSLVIFLLIVAIYFYDFIFVKRQYRWAFLAFFIAGIISIGIVNNKNSSEKFTQIYTHINDGNSKRTFSSAGLRVLKWKASIEVIKENLLFGVGTGDGQAELVKKYKEQNFIWGIKYKFNTHNQYLEILLTLGLVGFSIWMSILLVGFYKAYCSRNIYLILFLVIFSLATMTESMLNAQKGIVFYAFFISLLSFPKVGLTKEDH